MIEKMRKFLILLLAVSLHSYFFSPVWASENFSSEYEVSYTVAQSGLTTVKQEVTITNLTSSFFVSKYSFTIGSEDIRKIKAWDPTGSLTPEIKKKGGETIIALNFRARVFGKGRKLKFGISYEFPGLAAQNGLLWEINLLRITNLEGIASYNLFLSVPKTFGSLLYSYPKPKTSSSDGDRRLISYTKAELLKGPPRLAFGEFQLYELHLAYHLENPSFTLGYTEIALPPDIPDQQQVVVKDLYPQPVIIRVDSDGNYLARYNLGPREKKEVVWEGLIALFYSPRSFGNQKRGDIPQELVNFYTGLDKYWEVDSPMIVSQAQKLFSPDLSVAQNAKKIFDFVVDHLSYNYSKLASGEVITRLGAAAALEESDKAVCMEYTDLFITLARAAGIPAREINGFAYTADESHRPLSLRLQGGDVLHAWPEVYLPGSGWVMVDPTWSSTSGADYFSVFDLSHIAFVTKGSSSEYPLPAGSYKAESGQRDVKVSFSTEVSVVEQLPQLSIEIDFPLLPISPFPTVAAIRIRNGSNVAAFNTKIMFTSSLLKIDGEETVNLGVIPPGGTIETKIRLAPESFRTKGEQHLTAKLLASNFAGEETSAFAEEKTVVRPLYLPLPPLYLLILIGVLFLSYRLSLPLIKTLST